MKPGQFEFILLSISGFLMLFFSLVLFFQGKKRSTFFLGLTAFFSAIFNFVYAGHYYLGSNLLLIRLTWFGALSIPSYIIFLYYFSNQTKNIFLKSFFWYFSALIFLCLAVFTPYIVQDVEKNYPFASISGRFNFLSRFYILGSILFILWFLFRIYQKSDSEQKGKIKYFIIGSVSYGLISIVSAGILPLFDYNRYIFLSALSASIWMIFSLVAIYEKKLFEIKLILTEIIILIIATLMIFQILTAPSSLLKMINLLVFFIFLGMGYFLVKSVQKESELREQRERLVEELKKINLLLEEKVKERTKSLEKIEEERTIALIREKALKKDLERKVEELEKFQHFTIGRELRIVELKKENEKLKEEIERLKKELEKKIS